MKTKKNRVLWLVTAGLLASAALAAQPLTPEERQGQQIYLEGTSPSGTEILARIGDGSVEVPAAALPCGSCHGRDGRGNPEGGVTPSDLTWESLTRPYTVTAPGGRSHPPYDERLATRAIAMGVDPAGNELHVAMPRYVLQHGDMAALLAYLKRLADVREAGVGVETLRLGTMLPLSGHLGEMGRAMRAVLEAYFAEVNAGGGIYGRRLELAVVDAPADPEERDDALAGLLDAEEVFALVGAFLAGADASVTALVEGREVPLVGPFTLHPETDWPFNRYVFYLYSGLEEQGRALVSYASRSREGAGVRTAVVFPGEERLLKAADAVVAEAGDRGWTAVERFSYERGSFAPAKLATKLRDARTDAMVFLGSGTELVALLESASELGWSFDLLAPGSLAGSAAFGAAESFAGEILLSFPTLPDDRTRAGVAQYRRLASSGELPTSHLVAQLSSLAAAKVLVEGLKLAGRDVTREGLTAALEGLAGFRTGFTPPVTYNANRRLGAQGAWVVAVADSGSQSAGWIEVD